MRFHKAETAFFVFIVVALAAATAVVLAYNMIYSLVDVADAVARRELLRRFSGILFFTGVLQATALLFGLFFIYPLIRTQVKEEGKLRAMTESLSARSLTLEYAAVTDGLTGARNRRFFDKPLGLLILDLDHFKSVNDSHGHDTGDEVLKAVAHSLCEISRYHDVVARLGGEEFGIIVPNMNSSQLLKFADRIRKAVAAIVVPAGESVRLRVTTSVGLAEWDGRESAEELYRRADQYLYEAKRLGRNRISA
jgi:two-component system cell cycle response regulator